MCVHFLCVLVCVLLWFCIAIAIFHWSLEKQGFSEDSTLSKCGYADARFFFPPWTIDQKKSVTCVLLIPGFFFKKALLHVGFNDGYSTVGLIVFIKSVTFSLYISYTSILASCPSIWTYVRFIHLFSCEMPCSNMWSIMSNHECVFPLVQGLFAGFTGGSEMNQKRWSDAPFIMKLRDPTVMCGGKAKNLTFSKVKFYK